MKPADFHIQNFLDYLKFEKRYSAHTLSAYQSDLAGFIDYLAKFGLADEPSSITHQEVRSWLAELKSTKMTSKSISRKISSLKSFFKYCLRRGIVKVSPMAKVISPKTGKRLPVFIKEEDTVQLMDSLSTGTEDWKSLNAKMLITIFYSTGMRLSELINLKEKQVDVSRSQVKVLGKGNKERIIPVSRELITMIRSYQQSKKRVFEEPAGFLLVTEKGKKLYPKYAYLLVNRYLETAGTLDKRSPHILRHTFATHLMNNGADLNAVKELLGHSSLSSTQIYTHNTIEKLKDVHKKAHPRA